MTIFTTTHIHFNRFHLTLNSIESNSYKFSGIYFSFPFGIFAKPKTIQIRLDEEG